MSKLPSIAGREYLNGVNSPGVIPRDDTLLGWRWADVKADTLSAELFDTSGGAFAAAAQYVKENNVQTLVAVLADLGADSPLIVQSTY